MWVAPENMNASTRLVVWLASGSNEMEAVRPQLDRLANEDYLSISFDARDRGAVRSRGRALGADLLKGPAPDGRSGPRRAARG
jgi:hypothetical protein